LIFKLQSLESMTSRMHLKIFHQLIKCSQIDILVLIIDKAVEESITANIIIGEWGLYYDKSIFKNHHNYVSNRSAKEILSHFRSRFQSITIE